jgi:hypothetical protein
MGYQAVKLLHGVVKAGRNSVTDTDTHHTNHYAPRRGPYALHKPLGIKLSPLESNEPQSKAMRPLPRHNCSISLIQLLAAAVIVQPGISEQTALMVSHVIPLRQ